MIRLGDSIAALLIRQAVDVGCQQMRLGFAEKVRVRRHLTLTPVGDGLAYRFGRAAVEPDIAGQIRSAELLVAGAIRSMAGNT